MCCKRWTVFFGGIYKYFGYVAKEARLVRGRVCEGIKIQIEQEIKILLAFSDKGEVKAKKIRRSLKRL